MKNQKETKIFGIENNTLIYLYISYQEFEEIVRSKTITLKCSDVSNSPHNIGKITFADDGRKYNLAENLKVFFTKSWTILRDSDIMWRLNSTGDGVMIGVEAASLITSNYRAEVVGLANYTMFKGVEYNLSHPLELFLMRNPIRSYESEVIHYVIDPMNTGKYCNLNLDIAPIIKEILIDPRSQDSHLENVTNLCSEFSIVAPEKSTLYDNSCFDYVLNVEYTEVD